MTERDLDGLDSYEGISGGLYARYRLPVRTDAGELWPWVFVQPTDPDATAGPIGGGYVETVRNGLRGFGWGPRELDRSVREAGAA